MVYDPQKCRGGGGGGLDKLKGSQHQNTGAVLMQWVSNSKETVAPSPQSTFSRLV